MTSHEKQGCLIVFEGTDGTGKSTQLELLAQYLRERGHLVITTREPTDGEYGQRIRQLYVNRNQCSREEELALFLDDRRQHVNELLNPSLGQGKIVLCDRYFLSTAAYQGAVGFDPETILERNAFAPEPDLALLFQVPPEVGTDRIVKGRGDTLNDFEQQDTLKKVAAIFDSINRPYIRKINATDSIETVHLQVIKHVIPLLPIISSNFPD